MTASESDTTPLDEAYAATISHHNREYHRYSVENGAYFAPVDEDEMERLQIMHDVFNMMFDQRLIFPTLPNPHRVLDCGYGSASWAIDVAEKYPDCQVTGVDVYPYSVPGGVPENLYLEVDDLNSPSTFPSDHFDLVHSRMMAGAIHADRWPSYIRDLLRVLVPGGWFQTVEIYFNAQSWNGTLTQNHALSVWSRHYLQSLTPYKDPRIAMRMQSLITQAGFVEVESNVINLPMCAWSNGDAAPAAWRHANRENVFRLLSSLATYPFSKHLDMSLQEVQLLVAQARREAEDPALQAYFAVYVVIGRKPGRRSSHRGGSSEGHHQHHPKAAKGGKVEDSLKKKVNH